MQIVKNIFTVLLIALGLLVLYIGRAANNEYR